MMSTASSEVNMASTAAASPFGQNTAIAVHMPRASR
jgi:hypothetical protein